MYDHKQEVKNTWKDNFMLQKNTNLLPFIIIIKNLGLTLSTE